LDAGSNRPGTNKCIYTEGGVKCSVRTLPAAKFCTKHVLNDPFQVLFQPCGTQQDEETCKGNINNNFDLNSEVRPWGHPNPTGD